MSAATLAVDMETTSFTSPSSFAPQPIERPSPYTYRPRPFLRGTLAKPDEEPDMPEETSPFELLTEVSRVERTLDEFALSYRQDITQRVVDRLRSLSDDLADDPEEPDINADSLGGFLAFVRAAPSLSYPDILVSATGNIVAQWRRDRNRNVLVEFLSDTRTAFAMVKPTSADAVTTRGSAPASDLLALIEDFGARWVKS